VFVKAVGPEAPPESRDSYRREARISAALPPDTPAPRLCDAWELDGWVILMFEEIGDCTPPVIPWRREQLDRVLAALTDLVELLTPAPSTGARPIAEAPTTRGGWRTLAQDPGPLLRQPGVDRWIVENLDRLAALEADAVDAAAGETLLHADIRADNLLLTPARVVFVDWPHAAIGAPWVDLLLMLPSIAMQGGPKPDELFWTHPTAAHAERDSVVTLVAALAGFFVAGACQPPPPGLPNLRTFQRALGDQTMAWLRHLILS
jgi:hypothetical protein